MLGGSMKRLMVAAAAIAAVLVTIAHPAHAKFNVRVIIEGPRLVEPIELPNTSIRIGCMFSKPCRPVAHHSERSLGPRFTVTQYLEGHHARGLMKDRVVHDLYPYAEHGPWVFTASGQTWHDWARIRRVPGGWTPAHRSLMNALRANGLPAEPERPVERTAAPIPKEVDAQERASSPVVALVGLGVLLAGGAIFGRPRWKRRSPGP
jgi:hypothetical protein